MMKNTNSLSDKELLALVHVVSADNGLRGMPTFQEFLASKKPDKSRFKHEWKFDLPWHMVDLKDWFYMVDVGYIDPVIFLHVRIMGIRSLWEITLE